MASRDVPTSDLIDEDPRDTISRLILQEDQRLQSRQADLATARNALVRLHDLHIGGAVPAMSPITVEVAPTLLRTLMEETEGVVRNAVVSTDVGSALSPDLFTQNQDAIRQGMEQRTVYDDTVLDTERGREWIADWGAVGERQRLLGGVPSEFAIYGHSAVVGPGVWGDASADYVVIRNPMLVQAFVALFDRLWDVASPIPRGRTTDVAEDDHLLELLARGFKDEAIARYLGWSLRTVRRRVARLMDELGAGTRFQLGAEAVRAGRLSLVAEATGPTYQGRHRARLGRRERAG